METQEELDKGREATWKGATLPLPLNEGKIKNE